MLRTEELIGQTLVGCRIERRLGSGGMGSVLQGTQMFLERPVAVKVLSSRFASDPAFVARFETEGRILAGLAHPNIAQIYSMGLDQGRYVLVMEYVPGVDLAYRIGVDGPLPPTEFAYVFIQVAQALDAAATRNVIHRDVKPSNIMFTRGGVAKLVDFGIARTTEDPGAARRQVAGSAAYMSPEQARGGPVDHRSDLYSLGITMWHALMGRRPFRGASPLAASIEHAHTPLPVAPESAPDDLVDIIRRLCAKDPVDRPASAREVVEALHAFLKSTPQAPWALVIDPDPAEAGRMAESCRAAQLTPVVCHSGDEALVVLGLRVTAPQVVVARLVLPGVDCLAVLREAHRSAPNAPPRFVVLSAPGDILDAAEAALFRLGARWNTVASTDQVGAAIARVLGGDAPPVAPVPVQQIDAQMKARVARLEAMHATDSGPGSPALAQLVEQTARAMNVPVALVSLLFDDRQWFKAHTGLSPEMAAARGTPIEDAFCRLIAMNGRPLVVNDARTHHLFAHNRLVEAGAVGSYAGAPIVTPDGLTLGTVCVLDSNARRHSQPDLDSLVVLARRAGGVMQLDAPSELQSSDLETQLGVASGPVFLDLDLSAVDRQCAALVFDARGQVVASSRGATDLLGDEVVGLPRTFVVERLCTLYPRSTGLKSTLRVPVGQPYTASATIDLTTVSGRLRWTAWPVRRPAPVPTEGSANDGAAAPPTFLQFEAFWRSDTVVTVPG